MKQQLYKLKLKFIKPKYDEYIVGIAIMVLLFVLGMMACYFESKDFVWFYLGSIYLFFGLSSIPSIELYGVKK